MPRERSRRPGRSRWTCTRRRSSASSPWDRSTASACTSARRAIVEVVDDDERPVEAGTPGSKVLLTNLVNRAQPLIRYELSDAVVLASGPDPSGRPYDRIARIDGRSDDVSSLPARGGGEVHVHPFRLRAPFVTLPRGAPVSDRPPRERAPRAGRPTRRPRARPGGARTGSDPHYARGRRRVSQVHVELVEAIDREPGHAAKVKLVVSEVARAA